MGQVLAKEYILKQIVPVIKDREARDSLVMAIENITNMKKKLVKAYYIHKNKLVGQIE